MDDPITISKILQTPPPNVLFHYTNAPGLIGILDTKKIWTTKVQYLNDNSEIQLGLDYFRKEIQDQQKGERRTTRSAEELKKMLEIIDDIGAVNVGVASFTKMGDQLSQWRGYTQIGNGYSIGFKATELLKVVRRTEGYHLVRCSYQEHEHREIAKELVRSAPVLNIVNHPNFGKPPFFGMSFDETVLLLAPIIKSPKFEEEIEWRLISPIMSYSSASYRRGSHSIIPYWEFDLHLENTFQKIIIGPTPEKELSRLAISGILIKEFEKGSKYVEFINHIEHSNIPYRQT